LAQVRELRADHYGEDLRHEDEERALAILKKEFKARGWKEKRLIERREGDPEKLKIAVHLRRVKWTPSFGQENAEIKLGFQALRD
jgi:hypothetical protein